MNINPEHKPLSVTVQTARKLTGLGNTKIYELIRDGRLKSTTVDGRRLIIFRSIEELIGQGAA